MNIYSVVIPYICEIEYKVEASSEKEAIVLAKRINNYTLDQIEVIEKYDGGEISVEIIE